MSPHVIKVSILVMATILVTWLVNLSPYNSSFLLEHFFDWNINIETQVLSLLVFGFMVFDTLVLLAEMQRR